MTFATPDSSERTLSLVIMSEQLPAVEDVILDVLSQLKKEFRRAMLPLNVYDVYCKDPPAGGAHPFKLVVYTPCSCPSSTVFISNRRDGWNSFCYLMAERHKKFQIQVTSTSNHAKYPKNMFQTWHDGRSSRIVMALRDDDKWKFSERGETQPFEENGLYLHKLIKERMNRNIIISYLNKIGYHVDSAAFWESTTDGIYFLE